MKADDDGYLWFCGRKKQIIIHDGSNICPQEVEEALLEHPAVASAGVVGIARSGPWRERARLHHAQGGRRGRPARS